MTEPTFQMTREEVIALQNKFHDIKHSINNILAVIMALSELSEHDPKHYEKLAKTVLTRCPEIVTLTQSFSDLLAEKTESSGKELPTS